MKTTIYDNGYCKAEVPLISEAHGIRRIMWGQHVMTDLPDMMKKCGRATVIVKQTIAGPYTWIDGFVGHSASPLHVDELRQLAAALTEAADRIEETTRALTEEELEIVRSAKNV